MPIMSTVLDLTHNETLEPLPEEFLKSLSQLPVESWSRYPTRMEELYDAVAGYLGVARDHLLLTNGVTQCIDLFARTYAAGAPTILPVPQFFLFEKFLNAARAEVVAVPYRSDYQFPFDEVLGRTAAARAVMFSNPGNPVPTVIGLEAIRRLAETKKMIFIDEVYARFNGETAVPLVKEFDNLVVARSFSKEFGLPGLRLGALVAQPKRIEELKTGWTIRDVNGPAVVVGVEAIKHRVADYLIPRVVEARARIPGITSLTNFGILRVANAEAALTHFASHGFLVKNLSDYPHGAPLLSNHIRFSIPPTSAIPQLTTALAALQ